MISIIGKTKAILFSSTQTSSHPSIRINPSEIAKAVINEKDRITPTNILCTLFAGESTRNHTRRTFIMSSINFTPIIYGFYRAKALYLLE